MARFDSILFDEWSAVVSIEFSLEDVGLNVSKHAQRDTQADQQIYEGKGQSKSKRYQDKITKREYL